MEKAAIYARYSSHNQTEQSIEGQLAAAYKYAKDHNYAIVKEYCDRAKTGTNDNREEFQKMLKDGDRQLFDVLIVWKVDRFGRNREEIAFNKHRLKKNKIRVEYVAENVSNGPEGVILESVLEGMAEYYSLQLSQNIRRGILESAKKCKIVGGHCPLGYRRGDNGEYEVDLERVEVVKIIFDRYANGETMAELTSYLNSHGYKTANGNRFTKNSLPKILRNELYIGTYKYKDIICKEDAVPAIVDKAVFNKVQEMLKVNRRMPSHKWNYGDYKFTGKLFCGCCEGPLAGVSGNSHTGVKYNYYSCINYRKHSCKNKPIRQDRLEEIVLTELNELLHNDKVFDRIIEAAWDFNLEQEKLEENSGLLNFERRRLAQTKLSIENLLKGIEQGVDVALVMPRIKELQEEVNIIEASIAKEEASTIHLTKEMITYFLDQFRKGDISDDKVQRKLIDTFINKIYLYEDKVVVVLNYSDAESNSFSIKDVTRTEEVRPCALEWSIALNSRTCLTILQNIMLVKIDLTSSQP